MKKPLAPKAPRVSVTAPKKTGLLRKAARVGATVVATRVAADTGKKGVFGLLAGMGAKRIIMRYPVGALVVTGAIWRASFMRPSERLIASARSRPCRISARNQCLSLPRAK